MKHTQVLNKFIFMYKCISVTLIKLRKDEFPSSMTRDYWQNRRLPLHYVTCELVSIKRRWRFAGGRRVNLYGTSGFRFHLGIFSCAGFMNICKAGEEGARLQRVGYKRLENHKLWFTTKEILLIHLKYGLEKWNV